MVTHLEAAPGTGHADPGVTVRHPAVFLVLVLPYGISAGYITVTLAFLLARAGLPTAAVTTVIAASVWPQTWKVLWAPVIDTVGDPRAWYGAGAVLTAAGLLAVSLVPATARDLPLLTGLVLASSAVSSLVSMAAEIVMTHGTVAGTRGRASGWSQAGNVGGSGVGGGIGLFLAEHASRPWVSGAALAIVCVACCAAIAYVPRLPKRAAPGYLAQLRGVGRDVWAVARSRLGYLALVIMVLPIASGAVPWAAIAGEWHAGADLVATVTGLASGVVQAAGALATGYLCDRVEAKRAYCGIGLLCGATAAAMVLAPRSPAVFVVFSLAYFFFVGCSYAAYSAVVLGAIGRKSAATNFNLMASLSNVPIAAMPLFDGWVHDRFGTDAMLLGELAMPVAAVAAFALLVVVTRRRVATG